MWEQNQHVFLGRWSGQACQTITGNGEVEAANCSLGAAAKKPSANPRGLGEEPQEESSSRNRRKWETTVPNPQERWGGSQGATRRR